MYRLKDGETVTEQIYNGTGVLDVSIAFLAFDFSQFTLSFEQVVNGGFVVK